MYVKGFVHVSIFHNSLILDDKYQVSGTSRYKYMDKYKIGCISYELFYIFAKIYFADVNTLQRSQIRARIRT